jgi:hypothetical protein
MKQAVLMKAAIFVIASLFPIAALSSEEDEVLRKASRIISDHRLLSPKELACSLLVVDDATSATATVTVLEKHDKTCGGDPETAPRRFTMEVDLKTGAAQWDNNDEMQMEPIKR